MASEPQETRPTRPTAGDRVRMVAVMAGDPDPIDVGTLGTVLRVSELDGWAQIFVDWDDGRSLILLDTDPYVVERS